MIAIYARQSVEKKDSISIETQIQFCKRQIGEEEYQVFADRGCSGKNINRPAFQSLLAEIKKGRISKVIIYKLDRMSRSILDFHNLIQLFKKYDVSFQSTQEQFDTQTPMGNAMLSITMVFAQLERETIQQRILDNYYARGEKGLFLGGTVPYGFLKQKDIIPSQLMAHQEQTQIILEMFSDFGEKGQSLGDIARRLNADKLPSPHGARWDTAKVYRILRNPVYVKSNLEVYLYYTQKGCKVAQPPECFIIGRGCFLYGKREANERKFQEVSNHTLSAGLHEGFITPDLFLKTQRRLDDNRQVKNTGRGKHTWLSGLVKCGYCQSSMAVSIGKTKDGPVKYFACRGRPLGICKQEEDGFVRRRGIRVMEVEEIVADNLLSMANKNTALQYQPSGCQSREEQQIRVSIAKIDKQIQEIMEMLSEGNRVTVKYLNERLTPLDAEKKSLLSKLDMIQSKEEMQMYQFCDLPMLWQQMNLEQKKQAAYLMIEKVLIKEEEIEILWRYSF